MVRNRDKLLNINMYDLLLKMNCRLQKCAESNVSPCIMDALGIHEADRSEICNCNCEQCIAKWLNMKAK